MLLEKKYNFSDSSLNTKINTKLFYVLALYFVSPTYFLTHTVYPEALWLPQGFFSAFSEPLRLTNQQIYFISHLWQLSAVLCIVEILPKFFSTVFFILTWFMFNTANNYGYQTHTYMPIVLCSCILAFGGKNKTFLVNFIFCIVFFSAGLSKLRNGGLDWFMTENLQNILVRSEIFFADYNKLAYKLRLNILLARYLTLTKILAFGVILLELISPVALFSKRLRPYIVLSVLLMQLGIFFTVYVNFKIYLLMYVFWINWSALFAFNLKGAYGLFRN